jgi:GNAT superfamily N-acetyltransferase
MTGPIVRKATPADAPTLLRLIEALAAYERLEPPDEAARERLCSDMSSQPPRFDAYLVEVDGEAVGYAIVFETYSSFLALPTLYLEDIFVLPQHRGRRAGYELFRAMVREAYERGCGRMEWAVLDWNRPAIDFYERLGAQRLREWLPYRLTREQMERVLAETSD